MGSLRVYAVSGTILRSRRYPRSSLTFSLDMTTFAKLHPSDLAIRACSAWRRDGGDTLCWHAYKRHGKSRDELRIASEHAVKSGRSQSLNSAHDLPHREKMWRERMERVRRMVELDPYEALFGYSNRILRGMRPDWTSDSVSWWRKEINFVVKNPSAAGKKVEIESDGSQTAIGAKQQSIRDGDDMASLNTRTESISSEAVPEVNLVYDPITNRMVEKDITDKYPVDIRPSKGETEVIHENTEHVDIMNPLDDSVRPVEQRKDGDADVSIKPRSKVTSFNMPKEELPEEWRAFPNISLEAGSPPRAEYEAYKSRRFPKIVESEKWLMDERLKIFDDSSTAMGLRSNRTDMETQFDILHSGEQEVAEEHLVDRKPLSVRQNKGANVSSPILAEWREKATFNMAAYGQEQAEQKPRDHTIQILGKNSRTQARIEQVNSKEEDPLNKQILHPSLNINAKRDILNYTREVANTNIWTKYFADQVKARQEAEDLLCEIRNKNIQSFNHGSQNFEEGSKKRHELRDLLLEGLHEVKKTLQEAREEIKAIETRGDREEFKAEKRLEGHLEQHQERDGASANTPLETSLQRMNKKSTSNPGPVEISTETFSAQIRTHDPVGYSHERESKRLKYLSLETDQSLRDRSLADMVGNTMKAKQKDREPIVMSKISLEAAKLNNEIDAQKTSLKSYETFRRSSEAQNIAEDAANRGSELSDPQAETKELDPKESDIALLGENRHVDEDADGPTTASHTHPLKVKADSTVQKNDENEVLPDVNMPSYDVGAAQNAETPKKIEAPTPASQVESVEPEPATCLSPPAPAKVVRYKILAYDAKSKKMTTASFESVFFPNETIIPTTITLRHLTYANRFLPKLVKWQHQGFVPVHAEGNLLILRQDAESKADANSAFDLSDALVQEESVADDGKPVETKEPKRLEPVFSGRYSQKYAENAWRKWKDMRRQARIAQRRRFKRVIKFMAGCVVVSGAMIYIAGVVAEVRHDRGRRKFVVSEEKRI
ncbi:hypothetical protein, variant [Verruconis gallopava]|uniref:Uncharacterized protein n=1 Tax=Verruconis gallopava TaxID=253628 RepID=A0A0D1YZM8_9PEZI|nr:uncharacterized protein PV09_03324 [Verruconis gallopava]XP_016216032.1 hypothetical protein, variant [Verruconis gallopava]KIW06162.1 hypothetical protein PV09_03324 [Verruconis gallopava]KIW06163.1 hypothetical protein, variant [Verruconis gallopava]